MKFGSRIEFKANCALDDTGPEESSSSLPEVWPAANASRAKAASSASSSFLAKFAGAGITAWM